MILRRHRRPAPPGFETAKGGFALRTQVRLLVGVPLALALFVAGAGFVVSTHLADTELALRDQLRPAQLGIRDLSRALGDQSASARGYLLTHDAELLSDYRSSTQRVHSILGSVRPLLGGSPPAAALTGELAALVRELQLRVMDPSVALAQARRATPRTSAAAAVIAAKPLDAAIRSHVDALQRANDRMIAVNVHKVTADNDWLIGIAAAAGLCVLVVAAFTSRVLRHSLARPIKDLVADVETVARGDIEHQVMTVGPPEVARIARGVETMRTRLLAERAEAAEAEARLARLEEHERIASDLHDTVIQRVFATGLTLQAAAARDPSLADVVKHAVDDLDTTIHELRLVIFGLDTNRRDLGVRDRVLAIAVESQRGLGFEPSVRFVGPIDSTVSSTVGDECMKVLRELLSNIARHARASTVRIGLGSEAGIFTLSVDDDGCGLPADAEANGGNGLRNVTERARRLGGTCTFLPSAAGGTRVEWRVPAAGTRSPSDARAEHLGQCAEGALTQAPSAGSLTNDRDARPVSRS